MGKHFTHRCLGVSVILDSSDRSSQRLAETMKAFNGCLAAAIDGTRARLRDDRSGQRAYDVLNPHLQSAQRTESVSVLDDCGLPVVDQFGSFINRFLTNDVTPALLPSVGLSRDTLVPLWNPIAIGEIVSIGFGRLSDYYDQLHYLARLNQDDDVWQGQKQQLWFQTFGSGLATYLTDLFTGRFLERNGTNVSLDWQSLLKTAITDAIHFDQKLDSPQLAGTVVSTLAEFLGDVLFQVPLYSSSILSSYRSYRSIKSDTTGLLAKVEGLTTAIANNSLPQDLMALIGSTAQPPLPIPMDPITQGAITTLVVKNADSRLVIQKLHELDSAFVASRLNLKTASDGLDAVEAKKSDLQGKFTCFRAKVILGYVKDNYVPDQASQGQPGRDNDTGSLDLTTGKMDYSDLFGKLVGYAANAAEKSVRSLVGGLIRGIAIASLQNEVIAEAVASIAGTLAKKVVENVTYTGLTAFLNGQTDPTDKRILLNLLAQGLGLLDSSGQYFEL